MHVPIGVPLTHHRRSPSSRQQALDWVVLGDLTLCDSSRTMRCQRMQASGLALRRSAAVAPCRHPAEKSAPSVCWSFVQIMFARRL